MPCLEWFDAQEAKYRDAVLDPAVSARVSVEAGATLGWWKYIGTHGRAIGLDHFGASADYQVLYREFGITVEAIVAAARESIAAATGR
jgi:transketolase